MPIGVPRIIYCWGEELPPQWTDIYNFIFRRRMVFLMQYLDDELCNQICGLLINIHMEDRSKELEKKEIEKSGIFKSAGKTIKDVKGTNLNQTTTGVENQFRDLNSQGTAKKSKKDKSMEDLLSSYNNSIYEEDLAIDENYTLEQYTLQKITLEWLNWNAQFFDYSDEPYLFYLAELLSKDFNNKDNLELFYNFNASLEQSQNTLFDVYSPFRSILNLATLIKKNPAFSLNQLSVINGNKYNNSNNENYSLGQHVDMNQTNSSASVFEKKTSLKKLLQIGLRNESQSELSPITKISPNFNYPTSSGTLLRKKPILKKKDKGFSKLLSLVSSTQFLNKITNNNEKKNALAAKVLGQRSLRQEYASDNNFAPSRGLDTGFMNGSIAPDKLNFEGENFSGEKQKKKRKMLNYLDFESNALNENKRNLKEYSRKQTKKALQEEESKKVFVIINSFGCSVGNGITVHDALQFIKAGSLTLGLGVAASAASLVLAGGTISERYVTEGCHVMIHQPEGGLNGQASDIWIDSQEIMKIRLDVAEIYSLSAHRPRHKILRDLDRDFYLTATETIHYGLADEIATNEVMHEIIEMTSKVWDYHDTKQQRLLEMRNSTNNIDTQAQS